MRDVLWKDIFNLGASVLILKFAGGFRMQVKYITLTESTKSSFFYIHDFHLLVLLILLIEITSFICINKINILYLRASSNRSAIVAKEFLSLLSLSMLVKEEIIKLLKSVDLVTFGEFRMKFSRKINLSLILHLMMFRSCLLHWKFVSSKFLRLPFIPLSCLCSLQQHLSPLFTSNPHYGLVPIRKFNLTSL